MKPLLARNQVRLGPARALELALSGMKFRLFRSGVTIAILSLAVAFLAHTMSHGLIGKAVRGEASRELERNRELGQYLTRFVTADSPAVVRGALARGDAARLSEYRVWGGVSDTELGAAEGVARRLHALTDALEHLPPASRAVVLADESADEVVAGLTRPGALDSLHGRLERARARLPGIDPPSLEPLVRDGARSLEAVIARVTAGHERAVRSLARAYPGQELRAVAARPPADFAARVRSHGFTFPDAEAAALAAFASRRQDLQRIGRALLEPETRSLVARELGIAVGDVGIAPVVRAVKSARRVTWFASVMQVAGAGNHLDAARVSQLFKAYREEQRFAAALGGDGTGAPGAAGSGLGDSSTLLLLGLSFLVCVVGVANAMLMSVTERFTEIATMKCLGGLDGFIMGLFVFEAVIQGAIGGVLGSAVGLGLALLRGFVEFGTLLGSATSALEPVLLGAGAAVVLGVVLAAVAAVGPAWLAARLAPMEAMRVD